MLRQHPVEQYRTLCQQLVDLAFQKVPHRIIVFSSGSYRFRLNFVCRVDFWGCGNFDPSGGRLVCGERLNELIKVAPCPIPFLSRGRHVCPGRFVAALCRGPGHFSRRIVGPRDLHWSEGRFGRRSHQRATQQIHGAACNAEDIDRFPVGAPMARCIRVADLKSGHRPTFISKLKSASGRLARR
jgi:hypothetical protein